MTQDIRSIRGIYFSPTGSTEQVVRRTVEQLGQRWALPIRLTPYTLPYQRQTWEPLRSDELTVWGTPVYAGRIPNKTLDFVKGAIGAESGRLVAIAVYGGRSYDNALAEMSGIARQGGLRTIAAAAVVARHTFSPTLNAGRPDKADLREIDAWCHSIDPDSEVTVPGEPVPQSYYTPLKEDLTPAKFLKAKPIVNEERCQGCGLCVTVCPMGSRTMEDGRPVTTGICIKCQACIRKCPNRAIEICDGDFASHVAMLEEHYGTMQRKNEFWG